VSPIAVSPRDLVAEAERELAMGHFIKATSISRKAGKLVDRIEELHLRFIGLLKRAIQRTESMEEMGYDVSEARTLISSSKDLAMKSDYESALTRIKAIKRTLNRATYLPFPLLNKNVDIISTALWAGTAVDYAVRIENPSSEPLGEIIIRPFFEDGMFHDVPERHYGNIGPRSFSESTFRLIPKGKSFDIGIDSTLLQEDSVVFRTRFSSRHGKATYAITIENNSDQIIRDIGIAPRPPGGLVPNPPNAIIEYIEPFGSRTVDFALTPASQEKVAVEMEEVVSTPDQPPKERVVRIEEPNEFLVVERTKAVRTTPSPEPPTVEAEEVANPEEVWDESISNEPPRMKKHVARDFNPQDEDYDLMLMSPYAYPESVAGKVGKGDRKRGKQDHEMEESV
jgi:hypothetical protein